MRDQTYVAAQLFDCVLNLKETSSARSALARILRHERWLLRLVREARTVINDQQLNGIFYDVDVHRDLTSRRYGLVRVDPKVPENCVEVVVAGEDTRGGGEVAAVHAEV